MDGKRAAIVVREYFEGISGICPVVFQMHSITRVDDGYEVMCGVCSAMVHGAKYRGRVGVDGKLAKIERVDGHPELTDVDVVPDSIIIGNLRRINTRQDKQICEHCETIGGLRATISGLAERDARKTTAIDELQKTIGEMKSKVEPPNLAVMALLHNLNVKTEALEAELRDEMQQKYVAIRLGAEKAATVSRLNETIDGLEETLKLERIDHTAEVSAITNTLHETIKALRTDVSDRDRHIEESGAVIAKLRIERNRLTHNLHDANDKLNSVVDVLDELKRGRLHTHKANEEIGKLVRGDKP